MEESQKPYRQRSNSDSFLIAHPTGFGNVLDSIIEKPDNLESSEESEEEEENEQQETTESQPKDTQELSIVGNASKFDFILGASIDASLEQALMTRSMSSATMKDFIHNTSTSYRHFSSFNATNEERERELLRGMSFRRELSIPFHDGNRHLYPSRQFTNSMGDMSIEAFLLESPSNRRRDSRFFDNRSNSIAGRSNSGSSSSVGFNIDSSTTKPPAKSTMTVHFRKDSKRSKSSDPLSKETEKKPKNEPKRKSVKKPKTVKSHPLESLETHDSTESNRPKKVVKKVVKKVKKVKKNSLSKSLSPIPSTVSTATGNSNNEIISVEGQVSSTIIQSPLPPAMRSPMNKEK